MKQYNTALLWLWISLVLPFFISELAYSFPEEFTCMSCSCEIQSKPVKNKCGHIFHYTCAASLMEREALCPVENCRAKIINKSMVAAGLAEEIALYRKQRGGYVYGNAESIRVARICKALEAAGPPTRMVLMSDEKMSPFLNTVTASPHMLQNDERSMAVQLNITTAELQYTFLSSFNNIFSAALGLTSVSAKACIRPSMHITKKGLSELLASYFDAGDLYGYQLTHFNTVDGLLPLLEAEISALPAGNFFAVVAMLQNGTGRIALISKERLDKSDAENQRERKTYLLLTEPTTGTPLPPKIYETDDSARLCEFVFSQVWLQLPKSILILSRDHPGKPRIQHKRVTRKECIGDFLPLPTQLPLAELVLCLLDSLGFQSITPGFVIGLHDLLVQNTATLARCDTAMLNLQLSRFGLAKTDYQLFIAPVSVDGTADLMSGLTLGATSHLDSPPDFHNLSDKIRSHVRQVLVNHQGVLRIIAHTEHGKKLRWIVAFADKQYSIALTERPDLPVYTTNSSKRLKILLQTLLELQRVTEVNIEAFHKPRRH